MVKMHVSGIPMSMSYSHVLRNSAAPATPQPISTPSHPSRPTSALGNIDEVMDLLLFSLSYSYRGIKCFIPKVEFGLKEVFIKIFL